MTDRVHLNQNVIGQGLWREECVFPGCKCEKFAYHLRNDPRAMRASMVKGARESMAKSAKTKKKKTAAKGRSMKKTTRKTAAKKTAKKGGGRRPNAAFMAPVTPSAELSEVVGSKPLPRTELTKKLWAYIKKNGLQDQKNKRMIKADDRLRPIFGKPQVNMFEMTALVNKHVRA